MTDEIMRCRDLLVRLTGKPGRYFRPSGTDDGTQPRRRRPCSAVGRGRGTAPCSASTSTRSTTTDPGAAVVTQRTLAAVKAGSIVSLHFDYPGTVAALPGILDGLGPEELHTGDRLGAAGVG